VLSKLGHAFDYVMVALAWVAGGFVVVMWLSINYEVVMRYFFGNPTSWVSDFNLYFIVYITMLGAAWLLKKDEHVKIEILVSRMARGTRRVMKAITSMMGAVVSGVMFWYSFQMTLGAFQMKSVFFKAVIVQRWIVFWVIPMGFLLLAIQFLRNVYQGVSREGATQRDSPKRAMHREQDRSQKSRAKGI